jgi:putative ABC transport system substrate-binding protein
MKKKFILSIFFLILLSFFCSKIFFLNEKNNFTVAIIQCASNRSLDLLRDSTIRNIKEKFEKEVTFIIKNADASLIQANTICSQLHKNKDIDLFFTIGAGPTQAIAHLEKERPILFAGINNPQDIGLQEETNVTGTIDSIDKENIFEMITKIIPNIKTIGILRTAGELNEKECIEFKELCQKENITCKDFTVLNESDVIFQTQEACRKIDALFVPTDSIVASAISFVIKETKKNKIPLFLAFNEPVALGALAACGIDYNKNGECIASMIISILEQKQIINKIKFKHAGTKEIYVNSKTAKELNLTLSKNTSKAQFIFIP